MPSRGRYLEVSANTCVDIVASQLSLSLAPRGSDPNLERVPFPRSNSSIPFPLICTVFAVVNQMVEHQEVGHMMS